MKTRIFNFGIAFLAITLVALPLSAAAEKGPRCSDGLDNDGDGLIDGADPDCAGGGGGGGGDGATTGDFRITIDWDGAITDHTFYGAEIDCRNAYCDVVAEDVFTFHIPETYWRQWALEDARACFGASLNFGSDAQVTGVLLKARDHHGSPEHWGADVFYQASFIGTPAIGDHQADFQGDCEDGSGNLVPCPDMPAAGDTSTYDEWADGYLTRAQRGSKTKKLGGQSCTCAWEDCDIVPNEVKVTVERLPDP